MLSALEIVPPPLLIFFRSKTENIPENIPSIGESNIVKKQANNITNAPTSSKVQKITLKWLIKILVAVYNIYPF